jgi:hypothetical protein
MALDPAAVEEALERAIPGLDEEGMTQPHWPSLEIVFAAAREWLAWQKESREVWRCWENIVIGERSEWDWEPHPVRPPWCTPENGHGDCGPVMVRASLRIGEGDG